jgi:hypothetical protein
MMKIKTGIPRTIRPVLIPLEKPSFASALALEEKPPILILDLS